MRVRGEITKYKVLFQLVSQVVEYEFMICRGGNHGLAGGRGQAREATGGVGRPIIMNGVMFALLR